MCLFQAFIECYFLHSIFFYLFTDSCSLIYFILRSSGKSKHVCILQCRISTFQCNLLPQLTNNKSVCKAEFYQSTNFALMFGRLYVTIIQGFQNSSAPVPCNALKNNKTTCLILDALLFPCIPSQRFFMYYLPYQQQLLCNVTLD